MIRQLEQISMNAWPALHTLLYDGWVIRFANGVTRRSNSIHPIYHSCTKVKEKINFCEKLYSEKSLPASYKMTETACPNNLDKILEELEYVRDAEASVQTMSIPPTVGHISDYVKLTNEFNSSWVERFVEFNGYDKNKTKGYSDIIDHIFLKRAFLDLIIDDKYAGCGLGVIEGKYLGIFDIVVNPDHRGKGFGRNIVDALLNWGRQNGAETAYLQVMTDNQPALNLYKKLGFNEVYQYWYRIKK